MGVRPEIILGIKPPQFTAPDPLEQYGKSLTLKHLMQQGEIGQRAIADDDATRAAYTQSGGDPATLRALLAKSGQYKAVQAFDKSLLETEEKRSTIGKNKAQTASAEAENVNRATAQHRDQLANVNDPQTAQQWIAAAYQNPVLAPLWSQLGRPEDVAAKIPQEPAAFQQWKQQMALGATKFIEMNRPHVSTQNLGGTSRIVATPGLGGAPTVLDQQQMTATPGEVMTDARTRSEGAANRGVTVRGQNMTDARGRELAAATRDAGKLSQPFEATIDGRPVLVQQNKSTGEIVDVNTKQVVGNVGPKAGDTEQKTAGYAQRMVEAEKLLDPNKAGEKPGVIESGLRGVPFAGKALSNVAQSDTRQVYRQAQEDWVRAKLRQESGAVIADEEMDREIRTYFPQIGDGAPVVAQKAAARKTAISAMEQAAGPANRPDSAAPATASTKPAVRIRGDDGYNALPKGARYIGPDGIERVK